MEIILKNVEATLKSCGKGLMLMLKKIFVTMKLT